MTYPWAERVIAALGDHHDEEECDGPDDLIGEINNLRSQLVSTEADAVHGRVLLTMSSCLIKEQQAELDRLREVERKCRCQRT